MFSFVFFNSLAINHALPAETLDTWDKAQQINANAYVVILFTYHLEKLPQILQIDAKT